MSWCGWLSKVLELEPRDFGAVTAPIEAMSSAGALDETPAVAEDALDTPSSSASGELIFRGRLSVGTHKPLKKVLRIPRTKRCDNHVPLNILTVCATVKIIK